MAYQALKAYTGTCVIYVGEWKGQTTRACIHGETAGETFQEELSNRFHLVKRVKIPRWPFSSDDLQVWLKNPIEGRKRKCYETGQIDPLKVVK
mmetsp:Transcript_1462/g.3300  ORF Transcript_1462/g.3300 Transcript_1462/m.3300 type:complete len:93 (-) Transcript_1462:190-468(-)